MIKVTTLTLAIKQESHYCFAYHSPPKALGEGLWLVKTTSIQPVRIVFTRQISDNTPFSKQHWPVNMTHDLYIDDADSLQQLCATLAQGDWVALDTEFLREKTYRAQLCLVQLGNADVIACVDPLAIDDLSALYALLSNPKVTKVLHAASQDLEIFYQAMGSVPAPVFDTQIAASLLGYGDQIGYGKLVELVCDTQLDKSQSRTDWTRRPLREQQISYAADDVRYLRDVYHQLKAELERLQRSHWLQDDFEALVQASKYEPDPDNAWRRVRQHQRLRGVQLMALKLLASWREHKAVSKDRPRKWIASDDLLLDLSRTLPATCTDMESLRSADAGFIKHQGQHIIQLIAQAKATPSEQWPQLKRTAPLGPAQDAMVDYLWAAAKLKASQNQITLSNLTNRKELEKLIGGDDQVAVLKSWRYTLLGADLLAILNGEKRLNWRDNTLELETL